MRRTVLKDAVLNGARIRFARGLRLDGNDVSNLRIPPRSTDLWSVLRRTYTGQALLFNLLALIAFVGAYGARVAMWRGVNRAQVGIQFAARHLAEEVRQTNDSSASVLQDFEADALRLAEAHPQLAESIEPLVRQAESLAGTRESLIDFADRIASMPPTLAENAVEYPIWKVMLSMDRGGGLAALAVLLIAYNVIRYALTRGVGRMREEEERSGFAPYWRDYRPYWYAHAYGARLLFWIAVASFCVHAYHWLTATVWLPA